MSTANRIIKNTMFLYVRMGLSIAFSFFTTRILLQSLGASDYGLYNVVAGALAMLGFISASMSSATQRFISYAEGEGNSQKIIEIFNNAVYLHRLIALIAAIVFVLAGFAFFNGVLNIPKGRELVAIAVYACMIFSTVFSITIVPYDAVLNAHENMKYYSLLGIVDVILKFLIALLVTYSNRLDKLLFYGILMAIESWIFRYLTQLYCDKHYSEVNDINRKKYVNTETLKSMSSFAGWNVLNIFSGMICLYGLSIIVNHYYGTVTNAALGIATQLSGVLMGLTQNMSKALTPVIVKSEGAGQRDKMVNISLLGCRFSFLVFAFITIPICFCLDPILSIWLKEVPQYTKEFCYIMLVSELAEQTYLMLSQSINAEGNIKYYCIYRTISNLLALPITIALFEFGFLPTSSWVVRFVTFVLMGWIITIVYSKINLGLSLNVYFKDVLCQCFFALLLTGVICYIVDVNSVFSNSVFVKLPIMYLISVPIILMCGLKYDERKIVYNRLRIKR